MRPQEIIARKRDGLELRERDIKSFIDGVTDGSWTDYQITALIMAMYLNELNTNEQSLITNAMLNSGEVLDLSEIDKPKADKHSTGGVGDKTSLLIAPMAAACGLAVPMISGRGLGHTGGTLDKLESIPGYNVNLTTEEFKRITAENGFAMTGQTADIAPADKKIYSLRDATATVSTIPLIVASIMSKKLAEGLDSLILDVKTGNGAFMESLEKSERLARAMVETGHQCGLNTRAMVTDMSEPLGEFVGNSLEVYECVKILRGEEGHRSERLVELSIGLTAQMLLMNSFAETEEEASDMSRMTIENGSALAYFRKNVETQGGDDSICDNPESLIDESLMRKAVVAENAGFVVSIDTKRLGLAIVEIGGGRTKAEDEVDPAVGCRIAKVIGERVEKEMSLAELFCRDEKQYDFAAKEIVESFEIGSEQVERPKLIRELVKI